MSKRGSFFIIFGVLGGLLSVAYAIFRRERQVLLDRLRQRRRLCLTEQGVVEYATIGQGPAVLVAHGTLGGYDQGLAIARLFDYRRFLFVVASRAGYLGSGIPTGLTSAQQADSYVALLDKLGLEKAAIIGVSGGGPSALQFAQRHPERCSALILLSAIGRRPPPLPSAFRVALGVQEIALRFDFIWWPLYRLGLRIILMMSGVSNGDIDLTLADPQKKEVLQGIYRPFMTASLRRPGFLIDGMQIEGLPDGDVSQISAPTLVAHSKTDPLVPFADGEWLAQTIPQARFLPIDDGGHVFFVVHSQRVVPDLTTFLETFA